MTKKPYQQFWNKKQGKTAGTNAVAKHAGLEGRPVAEIKADMSRAQAFMKSLKTEIRKAV
jgi:hypothetical protein